MTRRRVSTDDQRLDLQIDALIQAGVESENTWTDTASGLTVARPGLAGVLKAVQPGNVLVVWKFDRLARSAWELLKIADQHKRKDVGLRSLTQGTDTSGPVGALALRCSQPSRRLKHHDLPADHCWDEGGTEPRRSPRASAEADRQTVCDDRNLAQEPPRRPVRLLNSSVWSVRPCTVLCENTELEWARGKRWTSGASASL